MIKGIFTALITPFDQKGQVNPEKLHTLLNFQIKEGVNGIVALGTTSEAPTLLMHEKEQIMRQCVDTCKGNVHLMVGTGAYATAQTIENTRWAKDLGADSALIVTPFYNRPTQEGIVRHFTAVAEAVDFPIMLYNHPGRTGQNIDIATVKRLAEIPSIIGIKEASGNLLQTMKIIATMREQRPDFSVMCGDDSLLFPSLALGGDGIISVIGNLFPGLLREMTEALQSGDLAAARNSHYRLFPLLEALSIETNPGPIKCAMELSGIAVGGLRLPLCEVSHENKAVIAHNLNLFLSRNGVVV